MYRYAWHNVDKRQTVAYGNLHIRRQHSEYNYTKFLYVTILKIVVLKNPYLSDETTANSYKKHFQKFPILIIKKDLAIFSKPKYFRKNI